MQLPEFVNSLWFIVGGNHKKSTNHELQTKNYKRAFTLIELLIVITIIGILAALTFISFMNAQKKSRDAKRKSDLKAVKSALEIYYQSIKAYPPHVPSAFQLRCFNPTTSTYTTIAWGNQFTCDGGTTIYMRQLPKDPFNTISSKYWYQGSGTLSGTCNATSPCQTFSLYANLENSNDQDALASNLPTQCLFASTPTGLIGQVAVVNYCVIND